jgi:hypothetical protein
MIDAGIRSRDAADQLLHRMAKADEILRSGRGKYSLPGTPLSETLSEVSESQKGVQPIDDTDINHTSDASDTSDRGGSMSGNAAGKFKEWHAPKLGKLSDTDVAQFLKSTGWKA